MAVPKFTVLEAGAPAAPPPPPPPPPWTVPELFNETPFHSTEIAEPPALALPPLPPEPALPPLPLEPVIVPAF